MAGSPPNFHKMDSRSACIQGVLKVKVKVKGHVIRALLCWHENRFFSQANGWIAANLHRMVSRWTCIQGVLKVKVKGHVIRALLCWHENCFFSQANGPIATKLAHDGHQVSLHPECAQGQDQGQRSCDTRTFLDSWNELLRHWRSGFV